jgi:hypothetical protein
LDAPLRRRSHDAVDVPLDTRCGQP